MSAPASFVVPLEELEAMAPRNALMLEGGYISAIPLFARDRELATALRQFFQRRRDEFERLGLDVDALLARLPHDDGLSLDGELWPGMASVRTMCVEANEARAALVVIAQNVSGEAPVRTIDHADEPAAATLDAQDGAGPPADFA